MDIKDGRLYGIDETKYEEKDKSLTNEEWNELTEDLIEIVTKYSKDDNWNTPMKNNWGNFSEARNEVVDCIHKLREKS